MGKIPAFNFSDETAGKFKSLDLNLPAITLNEVMEVFIPLFWFLMVIGLPIALLVTSYVAYTGGVKISEIIAKSALAFLVYCLITIVVSWFMFLLIFAGAHSEPVGQVLDWKGKIFYSGLVFIYSIIGWLLCSFINGGLIKPWTIFNRNSNKTQSIFDGK